MRHDDDDEEEEDVTAGLFRYRRSWRRQLPVQAVTFVAIAFAAVALAVGPASAHVNGGLWRSVAASGNAYATIVYTGTARDYEFFVAARVLMQSLARLRVDADRVVLAQSPGVPPSWLQTLMDDGVRVILVPDIPNPHSGGPLLDPRFIYSLNKLHAWRLVEYARIVMLDVDSLFLRNTDELFQCGTFCAVFIDPCIFHTGLFVLQPSREVYEDMLKQVALGEENIDGADQGFLTLYFSDLLEKPLFRPPSGPHNQSATRLNGHYRLPFGYQMDASYYYLRLSWRVPCSVQSVVTFPGVSLLKPWYWWSWPLLPLGLSWHEQRRVTIGYSDEMFILVAEGILYALVTIVSAMAFLGIAPIQLWFPKRVFSRKLSMSMVAAHLNGGALPRMRGMILLGCITGSFAVPMLLLPTTTYPITAWALVFFGALAFLLVTSNALRVAFLPLTIPWLLALLSLVIMAMPYYNSGIIRGLCIVAIPAIATPCIAWSIKTATMQKPQKSQE